MKNKSVLFLLLAFSQALAACGSSEPAATPTPTFTEAPTATPTLTPSPSPTPIGGGSHILLYADAVNERAPLGDGTFLLQRGYIFMQFDLFSQKSNELISRAALEEKLGKGLIKTEFSPSPDGSLVLITATTSAVFDGLATYEYYVSSLDLSRLTPLLDAGAALVKWKWSPDSERLLGLAINDDSKREIITVNVDGSNLQRFDISRLQDPQWSADSQKLIWLENGIPMLMNADGSGEVPMFTQEINISDFSVSPDGQKIAYQEPSENFYIISDSDLSNQIPYKFRGLDSCGGMFPAEIVAWSNDSKFLILKWNLCIEFQGTVFPLPQYEFVDVATGEEIRIELPEGLDDVEYCGFSPDNNFVMITASKVFLRDLENLDGEGIEFSIPVGDCPSWIPLE